MSEYGPWKCAGKSFTGNDYDVFYVEDQVFTEKVDLGAMSWLLVNTRDNFHIEFCVLSFHAEGDGRTEHTLLMHGGGPSGSLRECRHIWWGEDGYTYYLNFSVVEAALRALRVWFDGD